MTRAGLISLMGQMSQRGLIIFHTVNKFPQHDICGLNHLVYRAVRFCKELMGKIIGDIKITLSLAIDNKIFKITSLREKRSRHEIGE